MIAGPGQHRPRIAGWRLSGNLIVIVTIGVMIGAMIGPGWWAAADGSKQQSDWPAYGRDAGGMRYAPYSQINRGNVGQLRIAWTYRTGAEEVKAVASRKAAFESTP